MLAVSGELDATVGGPAVDIAKPRRMIYAKVLRNKRDPLSDGFDAPDSSSTAPSRNVSVTALQSLLMMNGSWGLDRAKAFARRVHDAKATDSERIDLAYRLAFGRPTWPVRTGRRRSVPPRPVRPRRCDWRDDCVGRLLPCSLLNASEFLYVD